MHAKIEQQPYYNQENYKPQEACGITAIYSKYKKIMSPFIVDLQHNLQHRGRDSAGIATFNESARRIIVYKDLGKVKEVFPQGFNFEEHNLLSRMAIGHNRYGTSGEGQKDSRDGSQPMVAEWNGRTIAIAYNGNLPDSERQKLIARIPQDMPKGSNFDTEDIARAIVSAEGETWEQQIKNGLNGVHLAYALTIITDEGEIFGLRGPSGHWPLWVGQNDESIILASETRVVGKDSNISWREVAPGELVRATPDGIIGKQIFPEIGLFRCSLHDVYGARSDSIMTVKDGRPITHGEFRGYLGRLLAIERPIDADLYIGIPKTGLAIVEGYVEGLGRIATEVVIKLDDTRAFIGRDDAEINAVVNGNLKIPEPATVQGKKVVAIDDSLIRGKSAGGDPLNGDNNHPVKRAKGFNMLLREAGATEVHNLFALPKFVKRCDMGYYIRENQLVALVKREDGTYEELDKEAIAVRVGADSVNFLSYDGLQTGYEWAFGRRNIACMKCMGQPHPLDILSGNISKETREPVLIYSSP